jgi:[ribosomal protein S5]-alanine N-acetyltransferase
VAFLAPYILRGGCAERFILKARLIGYRCDALANVPVALLFTTRARTARPETHNPATMDLRIRRWLISDAPALHALANDIEVTQWMSGWSHPYSAGDALKWVTFAGAQKPPQFFAIELDGELVGGAGIEPRNDTHRGVAIVGYWLGKAYWSRGIATAALKALVERSFARGFRRLEAHVFEPNIASIRVLEKVGFICEGRLRASYVQRDGTPCDEFVFGCLADAYEESASSLG